MTYVTTAALPPLDEAAYSKRRRQQGQIVCAGRAEQAVAAVGAAQQAAGREQVSEELAGKLSQRMGLG